MPSFGIFMSHCCQPHDSPPSDFERFRGASARLKVLKGDSGDVAAETTASKSSVGVMNFKGSSDFAEPVPV